MKRTGRTTKVLSGISALALAFAAAAGTDAFNGINTVFAEDTAATTETEAEVQKLTDEQIKGTWEGFYTGYSNSTNIERTIKLDIYDCTDGKIKGFATITSEEHEKYYFTGNYNSETGKMNFEGKSWEENADGWGFASFSGTVDPTDKSYSGVTDSSSAKPFKLTKKSDDFTDMKIKKENIHRQWVGEYDGCSGDIVVRRNYKFTIDDISDDNKITGTAYFSPSEKADQQYAETGSYKFSGSISEDNSNINLQGFEWIEHPISENFDFVKLNGFFRGDKISGASEHGIWSMEATDIIVGDVNYDNMISADDLLIMKRYILMEVDFSQAMINLSDMNGDGVLNIIDFNKVVNTLVNP